MTYRKQYIQHRTSLILWAIGAVLNLIAGAMSGDGIHELLYLICTTFGTWRYKQMTEAKDRIILDDFLNDDK